MKTTFFTVALASFQLVSSAQLIVDFEGANPLSVGPGVGAFEFTVMEPQSLLQSVGVFDSNGGLGLFDSHAVGIWNADTHALVASAIVPSGTAATFIDGAWYVNLATPIALPVGQRFLIGAFYKDSSFDFAFGNATSITAGQGIEIGHAFLTSSSEFSFPDIEVAGADYGFFGATGRFAPVPEPAAVGVVVGISLIGFAALRRNHPQRALSK